jgi:hypothetical protein
MNKSRIFTLMMAVLPLTAAAQVTDRVLFGNTESETAHGLTAYCPDYTQQTTGGLLNQTGRNCLMFTANPFAGAYAGIYGGEYCFVLRVDGNKQNYVILRTNGGDGVTLQERYQLQVDNKNLQTYERNAVTFNTSLAPGAFAYNTLTIPRKVTDGRSSVVVRMRAMGRYYGYNTAGNFAGFQRVMEGDMPPVYAAYSSTNPYISLADDPVGSQASYSTATARTSTALSTLKSNVESALNTAMNTQESGSDFKPGYNNNNFNIVLGMAYKKGYYGNSSTTLATKIRNAIDSMVYINNLIKGGANITRSALGNTATLQSAASGWGGLFGQQGMGLYLLWRAGKVTDVWLDRSVDLGNGSSSRRAQWIAAFKESFDAGCTLSGRRQITNQTMESALTVYGAAMALYALDNTTYHNAPKIGLRFLREATGLDNWTGVPSDITFNGNVKDADGYPMYVLGDSTSLDATKNFWGINFKIHTRHGLGREQGYTCTSCYGNSGPRLCDMYLMTMEDPYIGEPAGGKGDTQILQMAVNNEKSQAYFTYPHVLDGYKTIVGESSICWRNRYNPGKSYYNHLIVAGLSGDEELMGHVWQAYLDGTLDVDPTDKLMPYTPKSYMLPECIDKLVAFGASHSSDYKPMPSTPGQSNYVFGDEEDGVVAIKYGDDQMFVNFMSESYLSKPGAAHIVTPTVDKIINFVPDVMKYYQSGKTITIADRYYNNNHRIVYPDDPLQADGGCVYDEPAYDEAGHYNSMRTMCQYYQSQLGNYLVAQNCSEQTTYALQVAATLNGKSAVDVATGETVTLSDAIQLAPLTTRVFYITGENSTLETAAAVTADASTLQKRVAELITFAQDASTKLSDDNEYGTYKPSTFMPFFKELTMANYMAHSGTATQTQIDSIATVLETAYTTFVNNMVSIDACDVPGTLDYTKKITTTGTVQITGKAAIGSAKTGACVYIPILTQTDADYVIKVKAKGHVADTYVPSLNVSSFSLADYYAGNMPTDTTQTQLIAYNLTDYSTYQWSIHLKAGQIMVLRYLFGGTSSTYTVDVAATSINTPTTFDLLTAEIATAQNVLKANATSDLVTDAQRTQLSEAIQKAQQVSETGTDDEIMSAYQTLVDAVATFKANIATWKYPSADIQFRINNTTQSGTGAGFEVRNSSSTTQDYGFVGGIKFDISGLKNAQIISANLCVTTAERGGDVSVYPFTSDFGETGGTTDSYTAKQAYITEALAKTPLFTFTPKLGGNKKIFEWVPSATTTYTIKDWQVNTDVTTILSQYVSGGKDSLSLLFAPAGTSSARTTILSKDASASTYGTATTGGYYLSGDNIGQSNGETVTRWSRITDLLAQDGSAVSALYPTLTVQIGVATGITEMVITGSPVNETVNVYNLNGTMVRSHVQTGTALNSLPAGIYVINGRKYVRH